MSSSGLKFPKGAPANATGYYSMICDGTKKCYLECPHIHWNGHRKKYECDVGRGLTGKVPARRVNQGQLTKTEVVARVLMMDFKDTPFIMDTLTQRVLIRYPARHYSVRVVLKQAIMTKMVEKTGRLDENGRTIWRVKNHGNK